MLGGVRRQDRNGLDDLLGGGGGGGQLGGSTGKVVMGGIAAMAARQFMQNR